MIDPDIQVVLLATHALARQLDDHAQQAVVLIIALGVTELHKPQRPYAGGAIRGQGRQAQHFEMFRLNVCPRQWRRLDGLGFFSR
ncbi:hypothetical protein KZZ06_20810, partial [Sulfitobacter sp. CW3]|nr:hypothetical protein [Sulfitobacter sp. CW3]